jgi:protein SDA1
MMNFCSRLVGNHQLLLLPLYPFLTKYLTSHQRHVTQILCYAVQACHEWVPPDEVYLLLKTIAHNFITERCSEEQMAVGINAVRAICARVPSVLSTEDSKEALGGSGSGVALDVPAFVKDLAGFANHRDRSVSIAGKAWLNFVRETHPALLTGKSRGLAGTAGKKAGIRPLRYGEQLVASGVEGADLLAVYEAKKAARCDRLLSNSDAEQEEPLSVDDSPEGEAPHADEEGGDGWEDVGDGASEEDDDGWEEVDEDDDEEDRSDISEAGNSPGEGESVEKGNDNDDDSTPPNLVQLDENEAARAQAFAAIPDLSKMSQEDRDRLKQEVSSTRIFSASDFDKMRRLVDRERRLRTDPREAARRKRAIARGQDVDALSGEETSGDDDDDGDDAVYARVQGVVDPRELMADAKKKRLTRTEKLEKIVAGRTKFAAKAREGGATNVEKKRKKSFVMSKFSQSARSKSTGKGSLGKRKAPKKQLNHDAKKRRRKV